MLFAAGISAHSSVSGRLCFLRQSDTPNRCPLCSQEGPPVFRARHSFWVLYSFPTYVSLMWREPEKPQCPKLLITAVLGWVLFGRKHFFATSLCVVLKRVEWATLRGWYPIAAVVTWVLQVLFVREAIGGRGILKVVPGWWPLCWTLPTGIFTESQQCLLTSLLQDSPFKTTCKPVPTGLAPADPKCITIQCVFGFFSLMLLVLMPRHYSFTHQHLSGIFMGLKAATGSCIGNGVPLHFKGSISSELAFTSIGKEGGSDARKECSCALGRI